MIAFPPNDGPGCGIISCPAAARVSDWRGEHVAIELELPRFEQAIYYAPPASHWPVACCRMHPFVATRIEQLREGGMLLLLRTARGYLGMLPLALRDHYGWLSPSENRLMLRVGGHGSEAPEAQGKPVLAWAIAEDPYRVFAELFRAAASVISETRLREDKRYPEPFRYLGWCSWEEYHLEISEQLLGETVDRIHAGPIPIRYLLVDDGHQDVVNPQAYFQRRLRSFTANATKFPRGFSPLLDRRRHDGVRWMGLWMPFGGGMCGVAPEDNRTGIPDELLCTNAFGGALPKDESQAAGTFMNVMLDAAAGFDFVKIDFMSFPIAFFAGAKDWQRSLQENDRAVAANPYRQAWRMNRAMEELLPGKKLDLMNCNAHGPYNLFNQSSSNSSRCSCDYAKGKAETARAHLFQSYANIPWQGQLSWGDHDMFHSCDPLCGRGMAVSKAMSGGPVYLSDSPADFVPDNILPLCDRQGRLFRPLAPAAPLPESLFLEYSTAGVEEQELGNAENHRAYRVIAPLANGAAAIAVYHLSTKPEPITAQVSPDDYSCRSAMIQPYPGPDALPREGLVLWDWYAAKAARFNGAFSFTLAPLEDRLVLLLPMVEGWAVAGRVDKFLGPAAVTVLEQTRDTLRLRMEECGPLGVWLSEGRPEADGFCFEDRGDGFFVATMEVSSGARDVIIHRR